MYEGRMAVAVFSYDRPHYLRTLLASLKAQRDAGNIDVHLFQDGAIDRFNGRRLTDPEKTKACVDLAMHLFPGVHLHVRRENASIAIQQYEAYEELIQEYRFAVCLDDDVELGPDWIRMARIMVDLMKDDPSIFFATPGFRALVPEADRPARLEECEAHLVGVPWIGYVMDLAKWPPVRELFDGYYRIVRGIRYRDRPHEEIRALFRSHGWDRPQSSQDGAKDMAMNALGMRKLVAVVNRGRYLGEKGEHGTPDLYEKQGWKDSWRIEWPGDRERTALAVVEKVKA